MLARVRQEISFIYHDFDLTGHDVDEQSSFRPRIMLLYGLVGLDFCYYWALTIKAKTSNQS
jgi:hypothetical protein